MMLISNRAFATNCEYLRRRKGLSVQKVADDIGVEKKTYEYYMDGVKTPPPGFVIAIIKYYGLEEF